MSVTTEMERVILGAGDWFIADHTSGAIDLDTLCVEENLIGNTQGGASVEYTPETYTVEDDMGRVRKTFMTKATATMKTGLLTFKVGNLANVMSVGTLENGTLKLPGGKVRLKRKMVAFRYTDDETGETTTVGMIATNTGALSMAFAKDKETVPEITFTAESNGVDSTILVIEEKAATEQPEETQGN